MIRLRNLIFALQFLTIFPFKNRKRVEKKSFSDSTTFFPLVGLLLGIILALSNSLLTDIFPELLSSTIIVFLLVVLTGGLHLDGFADTVDALYAGKNRTDILRIMRDSHIGTMGVLALIGIIILKIGFLQSLSLSIRFKSLLIMTVLSRWSMVLAILLFDYARREGKAKNFFSGLTWKEFSSATLITVIIILFVFRFKGIALIFAVALSTLVFGKVMKRKIRGMTGDTLGAINEINEVLILLFLNIGGKLFL